MAATLTSNLYQQARQAASACRVPSFTTHGESYEVRDVFTPFCSCSCNDFQYRRRSALGDERPCKHVALARSAILRMVELVWEIREEIEDPLRSGVHSATVGESD